MTSLSTVERAFQLANGTSCKTVQDIRRVLKAEHYDGVEAYISGSLAKQLKTALAQPTAGGEPVG